MMAYLRPAISGEQRAAPRASCRKDSNDPRFRGSLEFGKSQTNSYNRWMAQKKTEDQKVWSRQTIRIHTDFETH
jgi:hypothetical protein